MPLKTNHLWQNTNTQAWDMLSWKKISSNDRFKQRFEVCQGILYLSCAFFFLYKCYFNCCRSISKLCLILSPKNLWKKNWVFKNQVYPFWIAGWKCWTSELNECSMNDYRVLENNFECLIVHLTVSNFRDADPQHYEDEYMQLITWYRDCLHLFLVQTLVLK